MSEPRNKTLPVRTFTNPTMAFMRVDFPQPLGPMMVTTSPSPTTTETPVEDFSLAVTRHHVGSLKQRHGGIPPK